MIKELSVRSSFDVIYYCGVKINEQRSGHVISCASLIEEGAERAIASNLLVQRNDAIRLNIMIKAKELPACVANLHSCLANMDRDDLFHNV